MSLQIAHIHLARVRVDAHAGRVGKLAVAVAVAAKRAAEFEIAGGGKDRDALGNVGHVQQCALGVDAETLGRGQSEGRRQRDNDVWMREKS